MSWRIDSEIPRLSRREIDVRKVYVVVSEGEGEGSINLGSCDVIVRCVLRNPNETS